MANINKMKYLLTILTLFTLFLNASCQNKEKHYEEKKLFIAPFVELTYNDSIEIGERFSNTYYNTEAYELKFKNTSENRIYIENSTLPIKFDMKSLDSLIQLNIDNWENKQGNDTAKILFKPTYINENGFIGSASFIYSKVFRKYSVTFSGSRIYSNGHTTFEYMQSSDDKLKSESEISTIKNLLNKIKYIEQSNIEKTEAEIAINTIIQFVRTNKKANNIINYNGEIISYEIKTNRIKGMKYSVEIPINFGNVNGTQTIEPNEQNQLIVDFKKEDTDLVKNCSLVLTTEINKKIKIPFKIEIDK